MDYETSLTDVGFTKRQRVDLAIHTLEGIVAEIAIDSIISTAEVTELKAWCKDNRTLIGSRPFIELIPKVEEALSDGKIDSEEQADILWLCRNFHPDSDYYNAVTSDIQRLQGILHGILADGRISDEEIKALSNWIDERDHLKGCYPYDEIEALLLDVLRDNVITDSERRTLSSFFENFITYSLAKRIKRASTGEQTLIRKLSGICSVCPDLNFTDRIYCFTGASARAKRADIAAIVADLGGSFSPSVSSKIHYLVIGANGNPAWAYSCYGRKVEQAVKMRQEGHSLILVHEHDFWDAAQDHGHKL